MLAAALLHVDFLSFVRPEPELPLSFPQWLAVILVPKRKHFCFLGVALPLLFPRRKAPDNLDFSLELSHFPLKVQPRPLPSASSALGQV